MVNIVWIYLGFSLLFSQLKSDFSPFSHRHHERPPKVLYYMKQCNVTGLNSQWSTCLIVGTSKNPKIIYRACPSWACAHQARCCLHRWWFSLIIFVSMWLDVYVWAVWERGGTGVYKPRERGGNAAQSSRSVAPFLKANLRSLRSGWFADEMVLPLQLPPRRKTTPLLHFRLMSSFSKQAINQFKCDSTVL